MPNPFQAKLIDVSGVERFAGVIDFDDPGNQPGGGGPPQAASLVLSPNGMPTLVQYGAGNVFGGVPFGGELAALLTAQPLAFGAGALVALRTGGIVAKTSGVVPASLDPFDVSVLALVTDLTGGNRASYSATQSLPSPVTDLAHTFDFSAASWGIDAGADLSDVAGVLTSAAGGVYVIAVMLRAGWD